MRKPFTLADLRKSACYSLNKHIDEATTSSKPLKAGLAPKKGQKTKNWIELVLQTWCDANGLRLEKEYRFHPERKWRFDFSVFKDDKPVVALEYNGIMSQKSRHTTVIGYSGDMDKLNAAQQLGWLVLQFTPLNFRNLSADLAEIKL